MSEVTLTIDGKQVTVPKGITVLEAVNKMVSSYPLSATALSRAGRHYHTGSMTGVWKFSVPQNTWKSAVLTL